MLNEQDEQQLINIAQTSIKYGLEFGEQLVIKNEEYSKELQKLRAVFITLKCDGNLRGCTGTLEPIMPLANAVAHSAYNSAFHDHRFPPVENEEFNDLNISISILSPKEEMRFVNQEDLLSQIRPRTDGLVVEYNGQRGTLLPSVWDDITNKQDFLNTVKQKAGFERDFWSDNMRVMRYTTHTINQKK